jgi:serine O-acetyltransferase
MIRTKADLEYYLQCDAIASKKPNPLSKNKARKIPFFKKVIAAYVQNRNLPWEYLVTLRKLEYYSRQAFGKLNLRRLGYKLKKNVYFRKMLQLRRRTNIIVESEQLGPGAYIPYNNIVVTNLASIGSNCMIESGVTIGITGGVMKGPQIGNNVFIGAGAVVLGDITIADGVCIGANAVVTKSVTEPNTTVAGVPARVISHKGSRGFLIDATEVWAKGHPKGRKI